ncbi:MAG: dienelactone hydrolase family protein [Candidatus Handelsmanbacteria bacterium]|nr:dienelactone hydrolase family protein [Candidatus Handelsmanbacteria bacterium]
MVIPAGERQVHAYLARTQGGEGKVAVGLIHEIFGLSDWVLSVVDHLVASGYSAQAPDLLSGLGPGGGGTESFASSDSARQGIYRLSLPPARVRADLRADLCLCRRAPRTGRGRDGGSRKGKRASDLRRGWPRLSALRRGGRR